MTKLAPTVVAFLLDKSGSMGSVKAQTIEAFNGYLATLRDQAEGLEFTFIQFDTGGMDKVYVGETMDKVADLTNATYQPAGGTPLIDAGIATIKAVEKLVAERSDSPKVIICFQTDGQENSSTADWPELQELIEAKQAEGWHFNFMGVGMDAYKQSAKMGLSKGVTMSYDPTQAETAGVAFAAAGHNTRSLRAGLVGDLSYTSEQRRGSGDIDEAAFDSLDLTKKPAAPSMGKVKPKKERVQSTKDFSL